MASGTIERKCTKGHKKAEGRCSPRCVRWYPRIRRATPDGQGRRRFDYLGGYPTRAAARAALDQALGRQGDNANGDRASNPSYSSTGVGGPAPPPLNDLLDHWLAHLQTNKALRLRTIGRYRQLLEHHVRPYLGTVSVSALGTLHIQQLYDQLAQHGRKDGKPGGLGPRTIRQVHLCLHQALGYAMKWHGLPANPATDAEPPAVTARTPAALTPEQVGTLLTAAHHDRGRGSGPSPPWRRQPAPAPASCAAWNGTTSTSTPAPCGSARPCPASTSSLPPDGRVPTAPAASCWSSAPQDPRQPGSLEPAQLRGRGTARLPAGARSASAAAAAAGPARRGPSAG